MLEDMKKDFTMNIFVISSNMGGYAFYYLALLGMIAKPRIVSKKSCKSSHNIFFGVASCRMFVVLPRKPIA